MKKGYTVGGVAGYRIKLESFFTGSDAARALGQYTFNGGDIDYSCLTKTEAKALLFKRLEFHGRDGSYDGLEDIGDAQEELNEHIDRAKEWVLKSWPYLKTKKPKASTK